MDKHARNVIAALTTSAYRRARCAELYALAQQAQGGAIVELGTFQGIGCIALALGAPGLAVYGVDNYTDKRGWAGERYAEGDEQVALRNFAMAGVTIELVKRPAEEAVRTWRKPIALLVWDLGVDGRLRADFDAWSSHIIPGGAFVVHDTADGRFGAMDLVEPGWSWHKTRPVHLHVFRRAL